MKFIILTLFYVGLLIMIVGYIRSRQSCPATKIEYRYVPRTFVEEQLDPPSVDELFGSMFREPSPWIGGYTNYYRNKIDQNNINQNFISQF